MALTETTVNLTAKIDFDENGNFVRGHRMPTIVILKDGVPYAKRELPPVELTLSAFKTYVAGL
jgi:hypothetical protein